MLAEALVAELCCAAFLVDASSTDALAAPSAAATPTSALYWTLLKRAKLWGITTICNGGALPEW